jgi:hypothetical protein
MLDVGYFPRNLGRCEVFYLEGSVSTLGTDWQTWEKPRGKTMIDILLVGSGGNGGAGAIGAASTAAGGGGGGSGGQTRLTMPLTALPDRLYLSLASAPAVTSYISIGIKLTAGAGIPTSNEILITATGGVSGGNAAGGTAGALGTAGGVATVGNMPLGWAFTTTFPSTVTALAGQAGIIGATTAAGGALTLPLTGLLVTGGAGGAGVGNAASTGSAGGALTGAGVFPTIPGGTAAGSQTARPGNGGNGGRYIPGLIYGRGGAGGGSTGGNSTGAGLVQASGGNGAPGCGGGGSGGAFTGSVAGVVGRGGPAFCLITVW